MTRGRTGAGQMHERLRIEREETQQLPGGRRRPRWVEVATVWARVTPIAGDEAVAGEQVEASMRYRIWIRNRRDITTAMRLVWRTAGDQVLNIRALPDTGGRAIQRQIIAETGKAS